VSKLLWSLVLRLYFPRPSCMFCFYFPKVTSVVFVRQLRHVQFAYAACSETRSASPVVWTVLYSTGPSQWQLPKWICPDSQHVWLQANQWINTHFKQLLNNFTYIMPDTDSVSCKYFLRTFRGHTDTLRIDDLSSGYGSFGTTKSQFCQHVWLKPSAQNFHLTNTLDSELPREKHSCILQT
jgi:hypothetical protein